METVEETRFGRIAKSGADLRSSHSVIKARKPVHFRKTPLEPAAILATKFQ
jgi:hypothetical protein